MGAMECLHGLAIEHVSPCHVKATLAREKPIQNQSFERHEFVGIAIEFNPSAAWCYP